MNRLKVFLLIRFVFQFVYLYELIKSSSIYTNQLKVRLFKRIN
jgi:hypothetical protein